MGKNNDAIRKELDEIGIIEDEKYEKVPLCLHPTAQVAFKLPKKQPKNGLIFTLKFDEHDLEIFKEYIKKNPTDSFATILSQIEWQQLLRRIEGQSPQDKFYGTFKITILYLYAFLAYFADNFPNNPTFRAIVKKAKEAKAEFGVYETSSLQTLFSFCLEKAYGREWKKFNKGKNISDSLEAIMKKHIYKGNAYKTMRKKNFEGKSAAQIFSMYRGHLGFVLLKILDTKNYLD